MSEMNTDAQECTVCAEMASADDIGFWRDNRIRTKFGKDVCLSLTNTVGEWVVSTVFLHINHNFSGDLNNPENDRWYETMVFGGKTGAGDDYFARYATKEQAIAGHHQMVQSVQDDFQHSPA